MKYLTLFATTQLAVRADARTNEGTEMNFLNRLARDVEGATAIEYALIAVFIGISLIVAMQSLGNSLVNNFSAVSNAENTANNTASG